MAEAPPNPWDRPRPKKHPIKSATTADELYLAIGKAISTWAMVEHSLCDMFTLMFTGKSGYAAYKMFGAYKSTSGRLDALRTAGEAYFSDSKEQWGYMKEVLTLTSNFLSIRNDIAHGVVDTSKGYALLKEPHYSKKIKDKEREYYEFDASEIGAYTDSFRWVSFEIISSFFFLFPPSTPYSGMIYGINQLPEMPLRKYVEKQRNKLHKMMDEKLAASTQKPPG